MDLPFAPVSRRIVLMARQGILDDVPGAVASELRALLREVVVEPAVAAYPHLSARLALV